MPLELAAPLLVVGLLVAVFLGEVVAETRRARRVAAWRERRPGYIEDRWR